MKHLKAYLSDTPRYQHAQIKEKQRYHFADYKTFIVIPDEQYPANRKVFMVKNKEVFMTQRKDFFTSLMKDLYQKNILEKWEPKLFSEVYLNLHLNKDARLIMTPQKANRYRKLMGKMKWTAPKKTILKSAVRFDFFAYDYRFDEVHKYNIRINEDGSIINKISPLHASCPFISQLKSN